MNQSSAIILGGTIMVLCGLIAFSILQDAPISEFEIRVVKHGGAFTGLLGIGVTVAGFLLFLINRYKVPV